MDIQKLAFESLPNSITIHRSVLAEAELAAGFPAPAKGYPSLMIEILSSEDGHGMTCCPIPPFASLDQAFAAFKGIDEWNSDPITVTIPDPE